MEEIKCSDEVAMGLHFNPLVDFLSVRNLLK
jgi:hypothetical protein